jgi:hypothetical protein
VQPEVPFCIELLRLALICAAWIGAGVAVPWLFFAINRGEPDPITSAHDAAHPTRGWWWLYPTVALLAVLVSIAWPRGFAS